MRFSVRHESLYRYDVPVRLAPHVLRLTPRTDHGQVVGHSILLDPLPVVRELTRDDEGNALTRVEFSGACQSLTVASELLFDTWAPPAVPDTDLPGLPWSTWAVEGGTLGIGHPLPGSVAGEVHRFASQLCAEVGGAPLAFLDHLAQTLHRRTHHQVRLDGPAQSALETLYTAKGACRDVAVLFMDAARSQGMTARFVSGYQAHAAAPDSQRYLHAWADVWLPGHGHHGWDPTHGCRALDAYVPLCAAPTQQQAMPIEGGFYFDGPAVNSTLDVSLQIYVV